MFRGGENAWHVCWIYCTLTEEEASNDKEIKSGGGKKPKLKSTFCRGREEGVATRAFVVGQVLKIA